MQSRKWRKKQEKNGFCRAISAVLLYFLILALLCDMLFGKAIRRTMQMQGEILATRILSDSISTCLQEKDIRYETLCTVQYDTQGDILAIFYDTAKINLLLAQMEYTLTERLSKEASTVTVSLGSLLGIELLSARGPEIPLTVRALGFARMEYRSDFVSAGINQTRHRILVKIQMQLNTYIPFYSEDLVLEKEVCLAETVLIGEVPEVALQNGLEENGK